MLPSGGHRWEGSMKHNSQTGSSDADRIVGRHAGTHGPAQRSSPRPGRRPTPPAAAGPPRRRSGRRGAPTPTALLQRPRWPPPPPRSLTPPPSWAAWTAATAAAAAAGNPLRSSPGGRQQRAGRHSPSSRPPARSHCGGNLRREPSWHAPPPERPPQSSRWSALPWSRCIAANRWDMFCRRTGSGVRGGEATNALL